MEEEPTKKIRKTEIQPQLKHNSQNSESTTEAESEGSSEDDGTLSNRECSACGKRVGAADWTTHWSCSAGKCQGNPFLHDNDECAIAHLNQCPTHVITHILLRPGNNKSQRLVSEIARGAAKKEAKPPFKKADKGFESTKEGDLDENDGELPNRECLPCGAPVGTSNFTTHWYCSSSNCQGNPFFHDDCANEHQRQHPTHLSLVTHVFVRPSKNK